MKENFTIKKAATGFFLFSLLLILFFAKHFDSNNDGFLGDFKIRFFSKYLFFALLFISSLVCISYTNFKRKYLLFVSFILILLVSFEFVSFLAIKIFFKEMTSPSHALLIKNIKSYKHSKLNFWGDYNENTGRWRLPNTQFYSFRCDDNLKISHHTNSVGARDIDRIVNSKNTRIVMLGDSFIEGFQVNTENRCSNLLENLTKVEHMNFAINSTSPINYFLTYKHLAKKYSHSAIIVGLLPANDFEDYTPDVKTSLLDAPIYRPYWSGNGELKYSLSKLSHSNSSEFIFKNPILVHQAIDSLYQSFSVKDKIAATIYTNSYLYSLLMYSKHLFKHKMSLSFSSFEEQKIDNWTTFERSLNFLMTEAKDKKVIFVGIPTVNDIEKYRLNKKNDFRKKMNVLLSNKNASYIDLLETFSTQKNYKDLFVSCDGHWNEKGEKLFAETLLKNKEYQLIINGQ